VPVDLRVIRGLAIAVVQEKSYYERERNHSADQQKPAQLRIPEPFLRFVDRKLPYRWFRRRTRDLHLFFDVHTHSTLT
jgi:hypothetical protein